MATILNPRTGRLVSVDGRLGKQILGKSGKYDYLRDLINVPFDDTYVVDVDVSSYVHTKALYLFNEEQGQFMEQLSHFPGLSVCPTNSDFFRREDGAWVLDEIHMGKYQNMIFVNKEKVKCWGCLSADCGHRFSFYLLVIGTEKHKNHANMILIDHGCQTYERFEPHGAKSVIYESEYVDNVMRGLFPEYQYYDPGLFCPQIGPQSKQLVRTRKGGFCSAWSTYYLQLRVLNPHLLPDQIVEYMTYRSSEDLLDYISRYCTYVNFISSLEKVAKML